MGHETDIKRNLKMNVVGEKNLRKPRNPYQLTPVYGTHQESKLKVTLTPSQYIIPFSH